MVMCKSDIVFTLKKCEGCGEGISQEPSKP